MGQYILDTRKSVSWGFRYPNTEKPALNKRRAAERLIVFSPLRSIWIPDEKKNGVFDQLLKMIIKLAKYGENGEIKLPNLCLDMIEPQ